MIRSCGRLVGCEEIISESEIRRVCPVVGKLIRGLHAVALVIAIHVARSPGGQEVEPVHLSVIDGLNEATPSMADIVRHSVGQTL